MDIQIGSNHYIIAKHLHTVISDPVLICIAKTSHNADNT